MPEIQTKDKLITLEELGVAYNNITPANIGAVATSAVIDIPHGGTGATGVETSRVFLDSSVLNLGIPATLYSGSSLRRWGKMYVLSYTIVIDPFTFQHSTEYVNLVQDEQGWLSSQMPNSPVTVIIDPNTSIGEASHGTTVVFIQGATYPILRIAVNMTWLDPN